MTDAEFDAWHERAVESYAEQTPARVAARSGRPVSGPAPAGSYFRKGEAPRITGC
jgi:hypothetical protein